MKNIKAYGTKAAHAPLASLTIDRRETRPDDVEIEILYCGVCHSDLHTARNDWGGQSIPLCPVMKLSAVSLALVQQFPASRRAIMSVWDAWSIPVSIVLRAKMEKSSIVNTEPHLPTTVSILHDKMPTYGGYSEKIVVSEKFVLKIPNGLDLKGAAPLLCAGITTWSPLQHWKAGKGSSVAVIGLGGLGHMAIKLAKAMGANVFLFTRSANKAQDARRLGADNVILSTDAKQMASVNGRFDLIIDTVPNVHDVNPFIPALSVNGTLVLVGYLGGLEPVLNTVPMIMGRKSVAGSVIGGIAETQKMLDFCGKHGITSDIEVIKIQDINTAYERMLKSDVKYRFVIDIASLKS